MSYFKNLDKKVKKMDVHDIQLTKLTVLAASFALISGWPWLQKWVISVEWYWFALAAIIFVIRPTKKYFFS